MPSEPKPPQQQQTWQGYPPEANAAQPAQYTTAAPAYPAHTQYPPAQTAYPGSYAGAPAPEYAPSDPSAAYAHGQYAAYGSWYPTHQAQQWPQQPPPVPPPAPPPVPEGWAPAPPADAWAVAAPPGAVPPPAPPPAEDKLARVPGWLREEIERRKQAAEEGKSSAAGEGRGKRGHLWSDDEGEGDGAALTDAERRAVVADVTKASAAVGESWEWG